MMKEHPYEFGGILFSIAIIAGLLGGIAGQQMGAADFLLEIDNGVHEMASGSGSGSGGTWIGHHYDYDDYYNGCPDVVSDPDGSEACIRIGEIQECKVNSADLQEFYACVHCPDVTKCDMEWYLFAGGD
tara:strand:+ start:44 stop:430 length:387 start_codon:yes stop_codon:yes gene_type:complete